LLDTNEQVGEQISQELTSSDTPNTDVYKPILTLFVDDDNTNDESANADLNVDNIGSALVNADIAVLSSDSNGDIESKVGTTEDGSMPTYINDADLSSEYATSIEIRGPPVNETVTLSDMHLVDPAVDNFDGQIVYFDFDGEDNVTYNGPVTVEGIDVPAFVAPGDLAGQEQAIITEVLGSLEHLFAGSGIIFTTERPSGNQLYSTIYVGGDDSAFADYGSFLGLAEQVDVGNTDRSDNAFVFSDNTVSGHTDPGSLVTHLTNLLCHETGHLLGYGHDNEDPNGGVLSIVAVIMPDRFEPNDSFEDATDLGTVVDLTEADLTMHESGKDYYDYYLLTPAYSGAMNVDILFSHSLGNLDLWVFDSSQSLLAHSRSATDNESVLVTVTGGQTYYLWVWGWMDETNPDYDLVIEGPHVPADRFEPNDSFAEATDLGTLGNRTEADLTIHQFGNRDYYLLTAGDSGTLNVDILFSHSLGNLDLGVYHSGKLLLAGSYSFTDNESVSVPVMGGQTYYVRVHGYGGAAHPDYDLVIDGPEGHPADRFEPNDSFAEATDLGTLGDRTEAGLTIHESDNEDYYLLTAADSGTLRVDILFSHSLGNLALGVYDSGQSLLAYSISNTDDESVSVAVTGGQIYYVLVVGAVGVIHPDYDLVIDGPEIVHGPEIDVEVNGTDDVHSHEFGVMDVGQYASQEFTVRNEGDADLVVIQAAGLISPFSISPVNNSGTTDNWVIPAGGTQTFTVSFSPDNPGYYSDTLVLTSNDSDEGSYQITVQGTGMTPDIIYVDDDATAGANNGLNWDDAFIYLQDALDFAEGSGGQVSGIWVAEGIYKPDQGAAVVSGDRSATFQLLNGVAVIGGYAGLGEPDPNARDVVLYETVLSGDLNGDDGPSFVNYGENSYHVVKGSGTNATAILGGFTITSGSANGSVAFSDDSGGGMYSLVGSPILIDNTFGDNLAVRGGGMFNYSSNPILINCTFSSNFAALYGGGMTNYFGSTPILVNSTFSGNFAAYYGGGMYNQTVSSPVLVNSTFNGNFAGEFGGGMSNFHYSNPTLISTTFSGNIAKYGGGMANYINSTPTLINSTFSGNFAIYFGGGMHNQTESSPVLVNCIFNGNFANNFGGGMSNFQNSSPTLMNSTFSGNSAKYGGGMFNYLSSNPTLTNSTFSGNFAVFYGGGMFNSGSNPTLTNSIFWLNIDSGGANESAQVFGGTPVINYSCIQGWTGGFGGTGNFGDDPMFVRNPDDGGDGWGVGGNDDYGDLHLLPSSPCIDAGDNTAVPPDIGDIDGDSNTTERAPLDLDGINRFIDDPLTIDTGLPDLPDYPFIVDMGAYEYHP